MARANRHFIPGHIWHLTHRCHKREFLLKFYKDRNHWMVLLFKANQRYQLSILNFHRHLSTLSFPILPKTMQFVAGSLGQKYNRRKNRKGAFWEDRYHATAIESGDHRWRCLVYVDLNMVRAGVVDHPFQMEMERVSWNSESEDPVPAYRSWQKETIAKYGGTDSEHTESDIHTSHDVTNAIPWKLKNSLKPAFWPQNWSAKRKNRRGKKTIKI